MFPYDSVYLGCSPCKCGCYAYCICQHSFLGCRTLVDESAVLVDETNLDHIRSMPGLNVGYNLKRSSTSIHARMATKAP